VEAIAGVPAAPEVLSLIEPAAAVRPLEQHAKGGIGMVGYAPIVRVSKNRVRCEGCKELVFAGVRHICIWNAQHHIDTLTAAERDKLIADLKALGVSDEPQKASVPSGSNSHVNKRPNRGRSQRRRAGKPHPL